MGAIVPVSAMNIMVIRGLNIILLMSTGVSAAEVCIFAPVSGNNDSGNILFSLVNILEDRDCVTLLICKVNIIQIYTFSLFNYLITVTTNATIGDW
jgi:hypothetical protein